jgi:hypothetical protein
MTERDLYIPLIRGANCEGWRLYRYPDLASGSKPFDIGGVSPTGVAVALEVKLYRRDLENITEAIKALHPHQLSWLEAYGSRSALGLLGAASMDGRYVRLIQLFSNWRYHALDDLTVAYLSRSRLSDPFRGWDLDYTRWFNSRRM